MAKKNILAVFFGAVIVLIISSFYQYNQNTVDILQVWVVPSLERIGQHDAPGDQKSISLYAALGESESFQIGIRANTQRLTNVRVAVSDLHSTSGHAIAASNVTLYREHYVLVSQSSPNRGGENQPLGPGWYSDALIPFFDPVMQHAPGSALLRAMPFDLEPATNQPIWVDVAVPREAIAGHYTSTFTIQSDQAQYSGAFELNVWNFSLPVRPSFHSLFLFLSNKTPEARAELLRHKLMPNSVEVNEQQDFIKNFGLNGINAGFWSGAQIDTCAMRPVPAFGDFQAVVEDVPPDIFLYNYTADEIDDCPNLYAPMKRWAQQLHHAGIANLVTMTPVPELFDDGSGQNRSAVDIWVLLPKMYDSAPARVAEVLRKGDRVWSYNALVQDDYSPKWEIDFAPINFRIQPGFISQSLGLTGLLYWRVDGWTRDPWNDVQTYTTNGEQYPGEGMLVYPGEQVGVNGVVPSIRLKWLRDGVEDYEYIELLKQRGEGDWALQRARGVGASWSEWTKDPATLAATRYQIGLKLNQANAH